MAEQASEFKRQTAYKCNISTLNKGVFVKKQGWESSYLMTEYGDFSRTNIIAVIVSKDENSVMLDDGTGQINGRLFDRIERLSDVDIGDVVLIIGRPREFNSKTYITIEIIKKISNEWINYRRKELSLIKKIREMSQMKGVEKKPEAEIVESASTTGSKGNILKFIIELDKGDGASVEDVLKMSHVSNGEEILSDMMMRGEVYESRAGYVKLM
jgi:RPA family protein